MTITSHQLAKLHNRHSLGQTLGQSGRWWLTTATIGWMLVFMLLCPFGSTRAYGQTTGMVEFLSAGKQRQGLALIDLASEMIVLGRDGSLRTIDPSKNGGVRRINERYKPMPATELRNQLRAEFGPQYEVMSTQHFLVVQPKGRGDRWPKLFEQSHRSFKSYMSKRGVKVRDGRFPMVAVVFPDQNAMYREFRRQKIDVSRVAGVYSNESNRVMTHDGGHLSLIAATVRHEAAHQSAFNSGVNSRVADTPKWITEGIGQMFESPMMTSSQAGVQVSNRANQDSLRVIKTLDRGRNNSEFHQTLVQLIGDNMLFDNDSTVDKAYAVSWAMIFYLAERHPKAFATLLNYTAKRPAFRIYEKSKRIEDFEQIVGMDMLNFSNRVQRFIDAL